jgi:hypothetical protein
MGYSHCQVEQDDATVQSTEAGKDDKAPRPARAPEWFGSPCSFALPALPPDTAVRVALVSCFQM